MCGGGGGGVDGKDVVRGGGGCEDASMFIDI